MEQPERVELKVSVDEAIDLAARLQRSGDLAQAEMIYRKLSGIAPDHPDVLHFSGVLAHQQGRSDEGIALIEKSLGLQPDQADCYSNLGIIFKACGRFDEAIAAYERAIQLNPAHVNAFNNLGVLLRATGKPVESEAAYRRAIELNPEYIEAHHNLGVLLASLKRTREAVMCYCKVTTLFPRHPDTRRLLALAYCTLGETDKAIEVYQEWLADEPSDPVARHLLAACTGESVPARASDACVERIFDNFAKSFESKLAHLLYRAPSLVGEALDQAGLAAARNLDVLDAGCGTGLCGPLVAPFARRLTGVDLSAGMLAEAEKKQVYDELVKDELTHYLRSRPAAFDVIVSADTLVYFGGLEEIAASASRALRPGGLLIFTLEHLVGGPGDADYRLEMHGRYAHDRTYVQRVLEEASLAPDIMGAELRMESGVPVPGLVVRARKGAHADVIDQQEAS